MSNRLRILQIINPDISTFFNAVKNQAEMDFIQKNQNHFYNAKVLKELTGLQAETEIKGFIASGRHDDDLSYIGNGINNLKSSDYHALSNILHDHYKITTGSADAAKAMGNYVSLYATTIPAEGESKKVIDSFRNHLAEKVYGIFEKTLAQIVTKEENETTIWKLFKHTDLERSGIKDITYNLDSKIDRNFNESGLSEELHNNIKTIVKDMVYETLKRAVNYRIDKVKNGPLETSSLFPGITTRTTYGYNEALEYLDSKLNRAIVRFK